jgi:hypothetical protein
MIDVFLCGSETFFTKAQLRSDVLEEDEADARP